MDGGMMCGGGMALGGLLILLLLVVVGYLAYKFGQSQTEGERISATSPRTNDALEIARRRYAQGEVTREEYEQLRRDLA